MGDTTADMEALDKTADTVDTETLEVVEIVTLEVMELLEPKVDPEASVHKVDILEPEAIVVSEPSDNDKDTTVELMTLGTTKMVSPLTTIMEVDQLSVPKVDNLQAEADMVLVVLTLTLVPTVMPMAVTV